MKKKKLITFYAVLFLIGINAVLWTYMWQEFQRAQFITQAIAAKQPAQQTEAASPVKSQEQIQKKTEAKRESVMAPVSHSTPAASADVERGAMSKEAQRLLSYEQQLQKIENSEGQRDEYASLVEDQILNGQRGKKIDYTVLKDAGGAFRTISNQIQALIVPREMSDQSKHAAYQAKTMFSEAYWHKAEAMALLANYLDTGEADWMIKYERKIKKSEKYIQDGINVLHNQERNLRIPSTESVYQKKE
ncbi:hypothetical protein [Aneurinibacillus sp. REN35]|uniref:hypothetical protein n=1 Tax=Aneurinibacillus sp. REN35 TaxID=3237286 RepID=UPI0035270142